jgi:hypothetical protein
LGTPADVAVMGPVTAPNQFMPAPLKENAALAISASPKPAKYCLSPIRVGRLE